jgi:hypothetical protein
VIVSDNLVVCDQPEPLPLDLEQGEISFLLAKTPRQLNLYWLSSHSGLLDFLVASVTRQPHNLITHIQRICLCYQRNLSDHLYGAMVDFFTALNGHADDFCGRLLDKVLPKLNASQAYLLNQYLQDKDLLALHRMQNSYMVLSKGLLGVTQLVTKLSENEVNEQRTQDFLQLARDYIEYSQFQEAKAVLEEGLLETPTRRELHLDILELYKSLQDVHGFLATEALLSEQGNAFPELWQELKDFFMAKNML